MRIYTRIVLDMTQDDMPVIESESYEYNGQMALCGWGGVGGSEGMGHETEGDGSSQGGGGSGGGRGGGSERGVGNRTASRGGYGAEDSRGWNGGGGSGGTGMRGQGGFGGLGIGNPTSYGADENPRGYEPSLDKQQDRDRAVAVGKGLRAVGLATGNPLASTAGWGVELAGKYGRSRAEMSDMERAAEANGMGEGERGRSSDSDKYANLPQGLVDYVNKNLAPKNDSYKQIADVINAARDKAGLNNTTPVAPKPVTDYSAILNKYSDASPTGLGVTPVVSKPYNNAKPNYQIDSSAAPVSQSSTVPVYQKAPAPKAINGGDMNGGVSLISGNRTLANRVSS